MGTEHIDTVTNAQLIFGNVFLLNDLGSLVVAMESGMTVGMVFYVIAAIILFLAGIGATAIPNPHDLGVFCIAQGLLPDEYGFGALRRR